MNIKVLYILLLSIITVSPIARAGQAPNETTQRMSIVDDMKKLLADEEYDEIIMRYAGRASSLNAPALEYISRAYYEMDNIDKCLEFADLALHKSSTSAQTYYLKGMAYTKKGNLAEALSLFQEALRLSPRKGEYYAVLGDTYLNMEKYTEALLYYNQAINQPEPAIRAYYMIGVLYADMGDYDKALQAFNVAKPKVIKEVELYTSLLQNIAYSLYLKEDYNGALSAYYELVDFAPNDYNSFEKIVLCLNALGDYSDANLYKRLIKDARVRGYLEGSELNDKIRIDKLHIDNRTVHVFERYETGISDKQYIKYIVIVQSASGNIDYQFQYRYRPTDRSFEFIQKRNKKIYTFDILFEEDTRYPTLKRYIVDIVSGLVRSSDQEITQGWKVGDDDGLFEQF